MPTNSTITAEIYCENFNHIVARLLKNLSKVYFLHDNAPPHTAKVKKQYLTSDFYLCHSLSHYLQDKKIMGEEHLKIELSNFFLLILSLPMCWLKQQFLHMRNNCI